ncbi:hypothetical protein PG994_003107 [Apiospora phragmitis]|uniref:Beta-lactamase-related domain-containing protein n=1 Tax=Apiospora phragmitis TaxID=2905665 RepID=A0ABR1W730_9PEZI
MRSHHVPGLSLAIVHKGKTASAGWGKASLDPPKPCTPDTLFDIASCSKSLAAASVALLIDDDENYPEVQWDAIMSELLPDDFVMAGVGYTENVTVDDILSHRTGMPRNLRNLTVAAPLRSKYMYNNLIYTVVSHLVEIKTKKTFRDFLEENFFAPLGMGSTSLQPAEARKRGLGDRIGTGGAGLVVSSAKDMIKWVKILLHCEGPPITGRIFQGLVRLRTITEPTWRKAKPHTTPAIYASGLEVHTYWGQRVVSHDGSGFGFSGRFFLLPDLGFGAVILGNVEGTEDVQNIVTKELIDELLGVPAQERLYLRDFTKKKKSPKSAKAEKSLRPPPQAQKKPEESLDGDASKALALRANSRPISAGGKEMKPEGPKKPPSEPQTAPLNTHTGTYWHPGYHTLTVAIREGKLLIDAHDRSFGFTIRFEHLGFRKHLKSYMHTFP